MRSFFSLLFLPGVCPVLCSGHGFYGGGRCHCLDGWKGAECDVREEECEVHDCSGHGECREGVCVCRRGWTGRHCQKRELCSVNWLSIRFLI